MKLRHPFFLQLAGFAAAWGIRGLVGSCRYRCFPTDPLANLHQLSHQDRFIFSFWHETLLLPAMRYSRMPIDVLISQHADGELIARACRHLGLGTIRGSSTRGGAEALRQFLNRDTARHIAITPDGPRGPRREVQPGIVYLAARTGIPIVPVGFAFHRCWRLPSWDRFAVPWPFSPAVGVLGEPLHVPADVDRRELLLWRKKLQTAMDRVMAQAEELAKKETW
jgi:lysophospholipid acyltransferase (LPLAT)-like uncharacterized protein